MKTVRLTFALFLCLLLWGCATGAKKENMAFISEQKDYPLELQENLQLGKVSVVEQGALETFVKITSEAFADALENSLESQGLFSDNGDYLLEVNMFKIDAPFASFTHKVTTHVQYTLTNSINDEIVFDETVIVSYTLTSNDVSDATQRLRMANEGSTQKNIENFLGKLAELRIAKIADDQQSDIAAQLDALDKKEDRKVALFTKLADDLPTLNTFDQMIPYLNWLRQKAISDDSETFRYSILYAFYAWKIKHEDFENTAREMILHAQLRLLADFSRCEKPGNSLSKYTNSYEGGKLGSEIIKSYRDSDEESKRKVFSVVIALEEKQKGRKGDSWLCSSVDLNKLANQFDDLEKREDTSGAYGQVGKTIVVESTEDIMLDATFISDEAWAEKREKVIANFKEKYQ